MHCLINLCVFWRNFIPSPRIILLILFLLEVMIFGVTLRILNYNFTDQFLNSSSNEYQNFSSSLMTVVMFNIYTFGNIAYIFFNETVFFAQFSSHEILLNSSGKTIFLF